MTDANTTTLKCANCAKTKSDSGINLKRCAKCQTTHYCSRECQKSDWKKHKRVCASNAAYANFSPSMSASATQPRKGLSVAIDKPFHQLNAKTWLHERPEQDVYKLLIDTYRFRMEDNYNFEGDADVDSIYGGARDGRQGFRRFLRLAEGTRGLLPSWWSQEKAAECEAVGMDDGWSSLTSAIKKSDVIEHYGNPNMPMQLRMFGEQVYGRGPGGQSGAAMRQIQMQAESGEMVTSTLDISSVP
jgi:splicing suppressor protein 51